jgi:hypothetical protein
MRHAIMTVVIVCGVLSLLTCAVQEESLAQSAPAGTVGTRDGNVIAGPLNIGAKSPAGEVPRGGEIPDGSAIELNVAGEGLNHTDGVGRLGYFDKPSRRSEILMPPHSPEIGDDGPGVGPSRNFGSRPSAFQISNRCHEKNKALMNHLHEIVVSMKSCDRRPCAVKRDVASRSAVVVKENYCSGDMYNMFLSDVVNDLTEFGN